MPHEPVVGHAQMQLHDLSGQFAVLSLGGHGKVLVVMQALCKVAVRLQDTRLHVLALQSALAATSRSMILLARLAPASQWMSSQVALSPNVSMLRH